MLENILKASEYKELFCYSLLFNIFLQIEDVTVNYDKIVTVGSYMYEFDYFKSNARQLQCLLFSLCCRQPLSLSYLKGSLYFRN